MTNCFLMYVLKHSRGFLAKNLAAGAVLRKLMDICHARSSYMVFWVAWNALCSVWQCLIHAFLLRMNKLIREVILILKGGVSL